MDKPAWVDEHKKRMDTITDLCQSLGISFHDGPICPASYGEMKAVECLLVSLGFKRVSFGTPVVNAKLETVYKIDEYHIGHGGSSGPMGEHPWLGDQPDEIVWVRCL